MVKMENGVVTPLKPKFYRRYVNDLFNGRNKNIEDIFFKRLNNYHQNTKLTIENNPTNLVH